MCRIIKDEVFWRVFFIDCVGVGVGVVFGLIIVVGVVFFGGGVGLGFGVCLGFGECLGDGVLYLSCKGVILGFLFLVWFGMFDFMYFFRLFNCFLGIGEILMYLEDWLIL